MSMSYRKKTPAEMIFSRNKKRLRLEGRLMLDDLLNEVIDEMNQRFQAALNRGETLEIAGASEEMREVMWAVAQKNLKPLVEDTSHADA